MTFPKRNLLIELLVAFGLFIIFVPQIILADSGACSSHAGVSCSAGPDYDGSVICNDGWRDSAVLYTSMAMCGGSNIRHDYSACDKHRTNPNLPKALAKARYDACVRQINSADYDKEWDRMIQESEAEIQRNNEMMRRVEERERQREESLRKQREVWAQYVENKINQQETKKPETKTINCGANAYLGTNNQCYCTKGYEVNNIETGCVPISCPAGYKLSPEWMCIRTTEQCVKEFGKGSKAKSDGTCIYCDKGYFVNEDWKCEEILSKTTPKSSTPPEVKSPEKIQAEIVQTQTPEVTERPIIKRVGKWLKDLFKIKTYHRSPSGEKIWD